MSRIATVTADGLHLRDGPGIEFESVGILTRGDEVQILGEVYPDGWACVSVLRTRSGRGVDQFGYLRVKYLSIGPFIPDDQIVEPRPVPHPPMWHMLLALGAILIAVVVWALLLGFLF